jgi:hypothetical protein
VCYKSVKGHRKRGIPMNTAEKIYGHLLNLPESVQDEVLDFVSYLETKANNAILEPNIELKISLAMEMRGMEDEDLPEYTMDDLKEVF